LTAGVSLPISTYLLIDDARLAMTSITEKLLDAAEYRMRRGGYNAVSFRDLAADTSIKSSSVHYHFPKKEDLGVALVERYAARFFGALTDEAAAAESGFAKLKAFQSVYRKALVDDQAVCLCGLLGAELAGLPEGLTTGIRGFFNDNIDWVEGALPDDLSNEERRNLASTIVATHQGAMTLASSLNDHGLFDRITDRIIEAAISP
jgi:TetR/AcrR family transcriptional repressor of nem operon